jgi:putative ABC transport system ATP-binding protein
MAPERESVVVAETVPVDPTVAGSASYELRGVRKEYGRGNSTVAALRDVDLTIPRGKVVAVVGPSGSGKSTLLQLLGALDRPTSGQVLCNGRDLATMSDGQLSTLRRETIGFIFQQFNLIPTLNAQANVEVALAPAGVRGSARAQRARALLETVGLAHRADHLPTQLSGGEQQRVAIARALANRPSVLLADEPTGNLDSATGDEILTVLQDLCRRDGHTVIVVTHDPAIAGSADVTIRIKDGRVAGS